MKSNFESLPVGITYLQKQDIPFIQDISINFSDLKGNKETTIDKKLQTVLNKNKGFQKYYVIKKNIWIYKKN